MAFSSRLSRLSGRTLITGGPVGVCAGLLVSDSLGGAGGGGGGGGLLFLLPDWAAAVAKIAAMIKGAKKRVYLRGDISKSARRLSRAVRRTSYANSVGRVNTGRRRLVS